ncbi:MAG: glycosyltransferase family 2 protein [Liquorilactobacillus nagelii]|uniref:glycosyltransferase family 2 protein n=1 Tax=Liquorilactobacillus nagelii TaxID=82688 RepID=UPI0039EA56E8
MGYKTALHASIYRLPAFIALPYQAKEPGMLKQTELRFLLPGAWNLLKLMFKKNSFKPKKYKLAVVVIVKNEASYLKEWLNYYLSLGAEHFYVYDNESTDNPKEVLRLFKDKITYTYFPGKRRQLDAYNDALTRFGNLSQYMAFVDADEFIYLKNRTDNLPRFLDQYFLKKNVGGLAINWQIFGSSNLVEKPAGLVTDNFVYRAHDDFKKNHHIKSVVDPSKTVGFIGDPHSLTCLPGYVAVDENGDPVIGPFTKKVNTKIIRINHYFTKSKDEFLQKKARGRATTSSLRTMQDFTDHDKNDVLDDSMRIYNQEHGLD